MGRDVVAEYAAKDDFLSLKDRAAGPTCSSMSMVGRWNLDLRRIPEGGK
jgi:hypothetical protein